MQQFLLIIQILSAIILVGAILIQSRGKGFTRSWGGSPSFTRRGLERLVFKLTFAVAAIFVVVSTLRLAY